MNMRSAVLAFPWRALTAIGCVIAIFVRGGPLFADKAHAWPTYVPTIVLVAIAIALGISAVRSQIHYERLLGLPAVVAGCLLAALMAYDSLATILP